MMQVNIRHVIDEQKANFDHFNELKTLILSIITRILNIYQVKKRGGGAASIREGASILINTVYTSVFILSRMVQLDGSTKVCL